MKKRILLLMFLVLVNSVFAQDFQNSESLRISVDVKGNIEIIPESPSYSIKSVGVNLSFFPEGGFNQKVLELDIRPEGEITDGAIKFEWKDPSEREIDFGFSAELETYNKIIGVKAKINFPIIDLDKEIEIYTKPSETIDSDDKEIVKLASELAKGEDDLYKAVFKLADWTNRNIQYNLSTLTEGVSQKASWVLENKEGVCDELTSLFIAMLRSVGVPARFVSGVAYTDSELFEENWGAHGWAEVYFPGYGFVPFDVTYGEFGFIDATHIKMRDSIDSSSSSTEYEWIGRNVDLKTNGLEIKAELIGKEGKIDNFVEVKADAIKKEVGFGSYNLIEVKVKNLKEHYVATELYLSKTESVEILGENKKGILLRPGEEKNVFWIVNVDGNLDRNFIYTFPFVVYSSRNSTSAMSFNSEKKWGVYSLEEVEEILKNKKEEEEKVYSREVDVNCSIDKEEFYTYEDALISCWLKNTGNVFLNELGVCFEEQCEKLDLGIMQSRSVNFSVNYSKSGSREVPVKVKNKDVSKFNYIEFEVLDEPRLKISNLEYPEGVVFKDVYEVVFVLEKESRSNPLDVEVEFEHSSVKDSWVVEELFEDRRFVVNLQGRNLKAGENDFRIFIEYKDKNNREYEVEEEFSVGLVNVTLWQHVQIFFNEFGKKLMNMNFRNLLIMFFVVGVVFGSILFFVFRKK